MIIIIIIVVDIIVIVIFIIVIIVMLEIIDLQFFGQDLKYILLSSNSISIGR